MCHVFPPFLRPGSCQAPSFGPQVTSLPVGLVALGLAWTLQVLRGGGVGDTHTRGVQPPIAPTRGISDVMLL